MKSKFDIFVEDWNRETFLRGAFGLDQDIDAYLDDPETTFIDNPFADELNDYLFPILEDDELIKVFEELK